MIPQRDQHSSVLECGIGMCLGIASYISTAKPSVEREIPSLQYPVVHSNFCSHSQPTAVSAWARYLWSHCRACGLDLHAVLLLHYEIF